MDKFNVFLFGVLSGAVITAIGLCIIHSIISPVEPLDVYRGKTTLEITYKDGIPCDSIVVWKE